MIRHFALTWLVALALSGPALSQSATPQPSLTQLITSAEAGQAAAQFALAEHYHNGTGVLQNYHTAATWFTQAAQQGHAGAQNQLGQYFHSGLGVARSQAQAILWLQAAADQGEAQHMFDLAQAMEQPADGPPDLAGAAGIYEMAAQAGHTEAAVSLGVLYQDGTGVPQDYARALDLYQPAATAGHARAQNNLGLLYVRGTGVAQDYTLAAQLFLAAAQQGLAIAMTNLSVMYDNGFGVDQSDDLATTWARRASQTKQGGASGAADESQTTAACFFDPRLTLPDPKADNPDAVRQTAESGDPIAQFLAGWQLCTQAGPTHATYQDAARWFQAAANKGHAASMVNLGRFYFQGTGVPQDYVLGHMWLTLASSVGLGLPAAQSLKFRQRMTNPQINEAQERALIKWEQLRAP